MKKQLKIFAYYLAFVLFFFYFSYTTLFAQTFNSQIEKIVGVGNDMDVGIAIKNLDDIGVFTYNCHNHFPMQSVYKFPIALAVLNKVDKGEFSLDQKILVTKKDLLPETWSPLREKYPKGNMKITIGELLSYMVSRSDNNACDILFRLLGGTQVVNDYIYGLGIKNISIAATEEEMHSDWESQFTNWAEPCALLDLLELFYRGNVISKESQDFLWKIMVETSTGRNRIKGLLPETAEIAHKTGSSGTKKGITPAINDIGIVTLPNGKRFAIVVLVSSKRANEDYCENIIAKIAKAAWDYYLK